MTVSQAFIAPPNSPRTPFSLQAVTSTRPLQSTSSNDDDPVNGEPINGVNGEPVNGGVNGDTRPTRTSPYKRTVNEPTGYSTGSGYSQFLSRREQINRKRQQEQLEQHEDGYDAESQNSFLTRMLKAPLKLAGKALPKKAQEPGTLVLVRHGESTWNRNQTFTGWADADLSEQGVREVEHAARLLLEGGYELDVIFTSRLKRAIKSVWILLQEMNQSFLPVYKSWRLNERMYGALTGFSKRETADLLGQELVQSWYVTACCCMCLV